jgi:hypothetical protein
MAALAIYKRWRTHCNEKSHLCIPFLGIAHPQSQFPFHVCMSYLYSLPLDGGYISVEKYQSQFIYDIYQVWFKKEMRTLSECTYCSVGSKYCSVILYINRLGPQSTYFLQQNRQIHRGNI